jgi:hypothetical protein
MTNATIPLEALLRRASRAAEQMFDEFGEVTGFWLTETATGEQQTIMTPIVIPEGVSEAEAKQVLAAKMRKHFKENNVARYACAFEAWMEHPQRQEIVLLDADDGCETLVAKRDIIRTGGKPYLAKLSEIVRDEQPWGRLADLLNDDIRPTSELPDDEGVVFVTDVPGAPFQVLGRRGPTGELFVGSIIESLRLRPVQKLKAKYGETFEIVTGPRPSV